MQKGSWDSRDLAEVKEKGLGMGLTMAPYPGIGDPPCARPTLWLTPLSQNLCLPGACLPPPWSQRSEPSSREAQGECSAVEFKPPLCTLQAVWPRACHVARLGLSLPTQNAWVVMRPRLLCGKKGSMHGMLCGSRRNIAVIINVITLGS